jgi:hypothetical protein
MWKVMKMVSFKRGFKKIKNLRSRYDDIENQILFCTKKLSQELHAYFMDCWNKRFPGVSVLCKTYVLDDYLNIQISEINGLDHYQSKWYTCEVGENIGGSVEEVSSPVSMIKLLFFMKTLGKKMGVVIQLRNSAYVGSYFTFIGE